MVGLVHVADCCAGAGGLGILSREENEDFDLLTHCQQTPGLADALAIPSNLSCLDIPRDWVDQVRALVSEFLGA